MKSKLWKIIRRFEIANLPKKDSKQKSKKYHKQEGEIVGHINYNPETRKEEFTQIGRAHV